MPRYLVDTPVLAALLNNRPGAISLITPWIEQQEAATSFLQAACFGSERKAGRAYFRVQEALYRRPDCDLSAYRFLLNRVPHVTVLGPPPPAELSARCIRQHRPIRLAEREETCGLF